MGLIFRVPKGTTYEAVQTVLQREWPENQYKIKRKGILGHSLYMKQSRKKGFQIMVFKNGVVKINRYMPSWSGMFGAMFVSMIPFVGAAKDLKDEWSESTGRLKIQEVIRRAYPQ